MAQLKLCELPDCEERHYAKGLCSKDYQRWQRGVILHPRLGKFVPTQRPQIDEKEEKPMAEPEEDSKPKEQLVPGAEAGEDRITIDIGDHPDIRDSLEDWAKKNIRTPENQAKWFIVLGLKKVGYGERLKGIGNPADDNSSHTIV